MRWIKASKANALENEGPPESQQHFDVWQFPLTEQDDGRQSYFGAMPPQIVENLLWLYTEPGQIVFDPGHCGDAHVSQSRLYLGKSHELRSQTIYVNDLLYAIEPLHIDDDGDLIEHWRGQILLHQRCLLRLALLDDRLTQVAN